MHAADFAPAWAAQQGIESAGPAELAGDERVRAAIQAGVDAANAKLAHVEGIKRFVILYWRSDLADRQAAVPMPPGP